MLGLLLLAASSAAARPVPVEVTVYATPAERDFGGEAAEPARWLSPIDRRWHRSLFVRGFASRTVEDPLHPGVYGVAMEGAGLIDPSLHAADAALAPLLARGWRYLVLDRWDERKGEAFLTLARAPLAADGRPLRAGVSAAVRAGDALFPEGRRVLVTCGGKSLGERLVHDECSSCADDRHIDLYVDAGAPGPGPLEDCAAELLPAAAAGQKK